MNKTLTAMVIAGALMLPACTRVDRTAESVTYSRTVQYEGQCYGVRVVDETSRSQDGAQMRTVSMTGTENDVAPYHLEGVADVPKDVTVSHVFRSGSVQYDAGVADGCAWGASTVWWQRSKPNYRPCTLREREKASAMLDRAAVDVAD